MCFVYCMFTLQLDRERCIGSATCQAAAAQFWRLDPDGKINLIKGMENADNTVQERIIDQKDFKLAMESAQACPVNAIHIIRNGQKLI